MKALIDLLVQAASAVSDAAISAPGDIMRRRLFMCALELRSWAIELRRGLKAVPDAAVDVCRKHVEDVLRIASASANGVDHGQLLAEALEAIENLELRAIPNG